MLRRRTIDSPIGSITLTVAGEALTAIDFADLGGQDDDRLLDEAERQLRAYFEARLRVFDLPLAPAISPFQERVREAMRAIRWGTVGSYGGIAISLGTAPRAVGGACGRNAIPIVIPCHRVLGSGGTLGGYSGRGGLDTKRWLLRHEGLATAG